MYYTRWRSTASLLYYTNVCDIFRLSYRSENRPKVHGGGKQVRCRYQQVAVLRPAGAMKPIAIDVHDASRKLGWLSEDYADLWPP